MAKRFRFRLETLLRIRRLSEREAQRKVAAKQAEIARIDELSRQARREILSQEDELRKRQSGERLNVADLSTRRSWIAHLQRTILLHKHLRGQREDELKKVVAELGRARTQALVVQKLRERRWSEYRKEHDRREQSELDELARQMLSEPGQPARG
ncbi:MAG: flagellar FliJ family protein [Planctomycetes bacterium]|nr:flagellar FliJ family protein [Planctomycetota bacterium]